MPDALGTFMRMANLYNPLQQQQADPEGMPSQLPVPAHAAAAVNQFGPMDEQVDVPQEPSILDAFRQSVLNPPQRTHMTYPKSTLNGLTEALKIASTPTDYEKNRVFIDGKAYQPAKRYKDPTTGEIKYIQKYKQPSFGEQVMKAMPAAVSPATDILNQPYQDAVADYELKNKGLQQAATAEGQMALAGQRNANAAAVPQTTAAKTTTANAAMMNAQTKARLADLQTLTDEQKITLLQKGKVTLQELRDADAMERVDAQQSGADRRTEMQQEGANKRTAATIAGANSRNAASNAAAYQRVLEGGNQARITKSTPSANAGATSQLPTQQKVALQDRTEKYLNANPSLRGYVEYSDQGFPRVSADAPDDIAMQLHQAMYGGQDINLPAPSGGAAAPITQPTTQPTAKPSTSKQPAKPPEPTGPPPKGYVYIEDLKGNFIGQVRDDANLAKLNTSKYRVRK